MTVSPERSGRRGNASPGTPPALDLQRISKAFDSKPALIDACFCLEWGEVHAIVGENGAGKSTLMNVAAGVYAADSGEQTIDGEGKSPRSPMEATAAGIGMVHQHFRLVERFTVAENVLLSMDRKSPIRSLAQASLAVSAKARDVGLPVDPDKLVANLSTAERQRVEIVRVLLLGARILVLDEPTAVLTDEESKTLLSFVQRLARQGHAVVLITHKFREVAGFCDRITIMRHGRTVLAGASVTDLEEGTVAKLMVGEALAVSERPASTAGALTLSVKNLAAKSDRHGQGLEALCFDLHAGEVLGVAGVGGNGQEELVACLAGLVRVDDGTIELDGCNIVAASPRKRRQAGLRVIPADRFATGLIRELSIADNLSLTRIVDGASGGRLLLDRKRMRQAAEAAIEDFDIRGASPDRTTALLSGGNAQKVLLARELDGGMKVLVAHSPSRGLDMKATQFVRNAIRRAVEADAACLLISEDLQEILSLSHRVAVMNRGTIVGCRPSGAVTPEWIGALLAGHD
ncbi:ABC transporter ATP-binding protein [Rhizobium laguerreae]|uniref:ATP-binding cassette domain-containing protein n=1 Tax=Rhizobium laguerreae TaxID=1076926 RepID=A0A6N9ZJ25_9HYPH|nr:ABC transporter ATP-binding protein [Rhizobium laguerreae]NEH93423.1 ATP-binding cassette domain-containing protein [Rhizobium laguerreae]